MDTVIAVVSPAASVPLLGVTKESHGSVLLQLKLTGLLPRFWTV
jgi:hypothetical protein